MKKRLGLVITIIVAALIVCLLVWRLKPRSSSHLISVNKNAVTGFSASAQVHNFEKDRWDSYSINYPNPLCDKPGEVLEILSTSRYQQDFRNLLPRGTDVLDVENYDGRTASVILYLQDVENNYIEFMFLSNSVVVVRTADHPNTRIYHPTNSITLDKLFEYLQTHGVME